MSSTTAPTSGATSPTSFATTAPTKTAATQPAPRRFDLYCLAVHHALAVATPTSDGRAATPTIILPEKILRDNEIFFVTYPNNSSPEHLSFRGQAYATERNADGAPTALLKVTQDERGRPTLTLGDPDTAPT